MARKIIDLSLAVEDNMPAHKLFQSPIYIPALTHETTKSFNLGVKGDIMTFQTNYIGMLDHVGTHVDAFRHVNPKGKSIDEMPLDLFMGKAVTLDLTHIKDLEEITDKHMDEAEKKSGVKVDGHIVLLCTGFHERNKADRKQLVWGNPQLTVSASEWLFKRGSILHGVEGPSTDSPDNNDFAQHRYCRDKGITHFEWLVNLEATLGKGEFEFIGLPIKFKGGSGSPVRAVAVLND